MEGRGIRRGRLGRATILAIVIGACLHSAQADDYVPYGQEPSIRCHGDRTGVGFEYQSPTGRSIKFAFQYRYPNETYAKIDHTYFANYRSMGDGKNADGEFDPALYSQQRQKSREREAFKLNLRRKDGTYGKDWSSESGMFFDSKALTISRSSSSLPTGFRMEFTDGEVVELDFPIDRLGRKIETECGFTPVIVRSSPAARAPSDPDNNNN